jgi:diacylglycerol kinase family enzyme
MKGITFKEMEYAIDKMAKSIQSLNVSVTGLSVASSIAVKRIEQRAKIKKRFFIGLFLMCGFVHAQDYAIISKLKSLTQEQANAFANEITTNAKTQWKFNQAKENTTGNYYVVSYGSGEKTFDIVFNVYYEGQNKALEIPGVKTYKFYEVWGSYLDLFPTWKKVFRHDVDLEKTIDDYKSQELINRTENVNFKLKGSDDQWHIRNWS